MHFGESDRQKPSLIDMTKTHVEAARAMKEDQPNTRLKDLVNESIDCYNAKVKKTKAYSISSDVRRMTQNLSKCPVACIELLQMHYLGYRHVDSCWLLTYGKWMQCAKPVQKSICKSPCRVHVKVCKPHHVYEEHMHRLIWSGLF